MSLELGKLYDMHVNIIRYILVFSILFTRLYESTNCTIEREGPEHTYTYIYGWMILRESSHLFRHDMTGHHIVT